MSLLLQDLSDERFDKRHKHNELTERKRKQFNSHTTAFELQQEARRLREQQKEEESQQLEPSQQTGRIDLLPLLALWAVSVVAYPDPMTTGRWQ